MSREPETNELWERVERGLQPFVGPFEADAGRQASRTLRSRMTRLEEERDAPQTESDMAEDAIGQLTKELRRLEEVEKAARAIDAYLNRTFDDSHPWENVNVGFEQLRTALQVLDEEQNP